ncbi:carbonic anhydrase family protein [Fluoribacter dumoffii]|uniref:Carbonic anhydrase n=1 Tax=Fluoribacter dumoffii TaxID=463 RepID=A0A377GEI5_9GAMM|nr:carbonic anhydrase family protein [Fluoribacter dumoffii]KTC91215.1 carbonic anhydrase [Fluoribacter dumoffii NY 23]MCW8416838.1 carbonic anhydrase family protein [Fluoribacter dumoffii]MCW8455322.1 carbonic anhydrase family protein [Fluoribacter dumoffii]MCW8460600.1 carbonic anhydrase family protein [Fluoribacter dumoffii]MCW8484081.1 carbonic anhydrase family protein [Fluoribacter dumoffii]
MKTLKKEDQVNITPDEAINLLKNGNQRFIQNLRFNRNLLQQVNETADGQYPFAAILSCIDSRTPAELIFDQGLGDIFSIRIAGNIVNEDIIGSLEFACKAAGSKLIVVLGHTNCGAIKGACDDAQLGYLTQLLDKIKPAISLEKSFKENRNGSNLDYVNEVARINIKISIQNIINKSSILKELIKEKSIKIVGGLYDVASGEVLFFDEE